MGRLKADLIARRGDAGDGGHAGSVSYTHLDVYKRQEVERLVGKDFGALRPGSAQAQALKDMLIAQNAWSQYLEVGIGPDAEIFTKAQPMSSIGAFSDAGLHPASTWNLSLIHI